jgi:hypothetical protein
MRVPLLSQDAHPTLQPWENQKHDWPVLHSLVPFVQRQLYGWIDPVAGHLLRYAGNSASTEFRLGGITIDPCPAALPKRAQTAAAAFIMAAGSIAVMIAAAPWPWPPGLLAEAHHAPRTTPPQPAAACSLLLVGHNLNPPQHRTFVW